MAIYITVVIASLAAFGTMATPVAAQNYAPPKGAFSISAGNLFRIRLGSVLRAFSGGSQLDLDRVRVSNDSYFTQFSDVSLVDETSRSGNLLLNGDFSGIVTQAFLRIGPTATSTARALALSLRVASARTPAGLTAPTGGTMS